LPAPNEIRNLVERFEQNRESYTSGEYNETQLRREFLDPFFTALGWDVDNKQGYAEAYKDVVHEDAIKIGTATKAPDYSFRIGGIRKFFVEAKKPSVNVKEDIPPAYQVRRYAWSAKLPLSILTDFEELAVYDCRIKPKPSDKPAVGRILYFKYTEYADRWDELAAIFSREAVLKGSFDKYVESTKGKRGTAEVDDAFLEEIENWREVLAKNIAANNQELSVRDLNFAVQRTIDRIIFLRICEDRGIETYGSLLGLVNGKNIYRRLCEVFYRADEKYNSGLFHFHKEKDRQEPPDEFTPGLEIDDETLIEIIKGLYYPDSSYEFSVLPADILGQVYEQFLGKVIRLTAGHQAKVEDKPEVKKAGGVYYTPTYIVDYIVKNTVGKILEELSSKEKDKKILKRIANLRILDPACGSGSFLIGAYQYLLNWHRDWYVNDGAEKWTAGKAPTLYQAQGGEWRLTAAERKRILLNNIYGVDIDPQAVEVTKLSLLLKVLEGENEQTISRQLRIFNERALPDLVNNIKCGNSLIGPDFYDGQQLSLMDDEERIKINAFDWKSEFKDIMDSGGFDVLIGNPPYIRIQGFPKKQVEYFVHTYGSTTSNYDIYVIFVERGLELLSKGALFGMILPNKFFKTDYGLGLRKILAGQKFLSKIVNFEAEQVFDATTYTCLLFLRNRSNATFQYVNAEANPTSLNNPTFEEKTIEHFESTPWHFEDDQSRSLIEKLFLRSKRLLDLPAEMSRGSSSGDDDVFILDTKPPTVENEILRIPVFATDFNRYSFSPSDNWRIIFPYFRTKGKYDLYDEESLKKRFPKTHKYLVGNKAKLEKRKQFREWFGFSAPRNLELHEEAQILVPLLADHGIFSLIPMHTRGTLCPMASGGFTVTILPECTMKPEYVLGILNSRLLFWRLANMSNVFRGGWITCTKQYFGELPIRIIDFSDPKEQLLHNQMVAFVETMVDLNKKLAVAKTEQDQTPIKRQIEATDKQIDELVYELYGLTEEERKIVEGN